MTRHHWFSLLLAGVLTAVAGGVCYYQIDQAVAQTVHAWHGSLLWRVSMVFQWLFAPKPWFALAFALGVYLLWVYRSQLPALRQHRGFFYALSMTSTAILTETLKVVFGRYRPDMWWTQHLYGFQPFCRENLCNAMPSGHTAVAFCTAMCLSYAFPRYRWFFGLLAVAVGASRWVAEQHYVSDTIVAAFIGLAVPIFFHSFLVSQPVIHS